MKDEKAVKRGRLGGLRVLEKYGKEYFKRISIEGGNKEGGRLLLKKYGLEIGRAHV